MWLDCKERFSLPTVSSSGASRTAASEAKNILATLHQKGDWIFEQICRIPMEKNKHQRNNIKRVKFDHY